MAPRLNRIGAPAPDAGALDPELMHRHCWHMNETDPEISAMSFEDALRALEEVVRKLEGGDVPLDDSSAAKSSASIARRGSMRRRRESRRLCRSPTVRLALPSRSMRRTREHGPRRSA
jgi:hypothetical protein